MNFPPINGVDEGSIVITLSAILSGIMGNDAFWNAKVDLPYFGIVPKNFVLKWTVAFFVYSYGFSGLVNVYKGRHKKHF